MTPRGLQPHSHAERSALIAHLLPLWQQKFGENLLAVAALASYARGTDQAYSDLELAVFLKEPLPAGEDQQLQRIVDGMLIEAAYVTAESYLDKYRTLSYNWYIAASEVLVPVYNPAFIASIIEQMQAIQHSPAQFTNQAAHRFLDVQESFGKVLNAIAQQNREGLPLLLFDAVMQLLMTLSFLNQRPFTTFALFVTEARQFSLKPARFDELLDLIVEGGYDNLAKLQDIILTLFQSLEQIFADQGFELYDTTIDPNVPNKRYGK